jgi:hypothetical protein
MPEILRDETTGRMQRHRAIHGSAQDRDRWHAQYERQIEEVERNAETYVSTLCSWMADILPRKTVLAVVGWFAHERGLSFWEALGRLFGSGDAWFVHVCQEFGRAHGK